MLLTGGEKGGVCVKGDGGGGEKVALGGAEDGGGMP